MEDRKVQTISCEHGKVFAACVEPECYSDSHWRAEVLKYLMFGCTIGTARANEFQFEKCDCHKTLGKKKRQTSKQLILF